MVMGLDLNDARFVLVRVVRCVIHLCLNLMKKICFIIFVNFNCDVFEYTTMKVVI